MKPEATNLQGVSYWDDISSKYDSLYSNAWSLQEDKDTSLWLDETLGMRTGPTLDLACGTGLGYLLLQRENRSRMYIGLDISQGMLTQFGINHPNIACLLGSMDDLSNFNDGQFDSVICLNTSFSFARNQKNVLSQIHRILRPNGVIFLSVLNRRSLRRILQLKFGIVEAFATRGADPAVGSVSANTFTLSEFKTILSSTGFRVNSYRPQGVLSGVAEHEWLLPVENVLRRLSPWLVHTLNISAVRI